MKLALAAGVLALAGAAPHARVLGWDYGAKRIAWFQPDTLTRAGGATTSWNRPLCSWSFAPDGRRVALADCNGTVRFLALPSLEPAGRVAPGALWDAAALAWVTPNRLLAVNRASGGLATLLVIDPATEKVVRQAPLGGVLVDRELVGSRVVFLVAPFDSFGPARVVVADADGNVRSATVDGIVAGSHLEEVRTPGFAVDPAGTAYVVGGDLRVAAVDLATLRVSYHGPSRAPAKALNGTSRIAAWLGNGKIAVSGVDYANATATPFGLHLLDTATWTYRTLDTASTGLIAAGATVLGTAASTWTAYDASGARRYDVAVPHDTWVSAGRGYAYVCTERWLTQVLDWSSGTNVATPKAKTRGCPTVLAGRASRL